jgi:hypothetical protein
MTIPTGNGQVKIIIDNFQLIVYVILMYSLLQFALIPDRAC